ncbi:MAG: class I adenylate-forming enzyme family protein [Actinomycetota bacterium]
MALRLPPGPGFLDALRKAWDRGEAVLPLDPRLPALEIDRLLGEMRPARLLAPREERELSDPLPVEPGVALVVPTSGSTGLPKGVELTRDSLSASAEASGQRLEVFPEDRWLACLPLHHIAGLMVLVRSVLLGRPPVFHARFDPEAIAVEREVTMISLVPTMLRRLLDSGVELSRFRCVLLGGGPAPPTLLERAAQAGGRVITSYGATETCGGVVYDARPLQGVQLRISPEGEILVRGPMVMRGYRGRPDLTAAALREGWFATGDAGEVGPDSSLTVLGRRDHMIVTGGEKVSPEEVEAVLLEHPGVADAAVFGLPDEEWGERVAAAVVPAPGGPEARGGQPPAPEPARQAIPREAGRPSPMRRVTEVGSRSLRERATALP